MYCPLCQCVDKDVCLDVESSTGKQLEYHTCSNCQNIMTERMITACAFHFADGFFKHDRPRNIEVNFEDEDGKKHHINLTNKVDLNNAPGTFLNDLEGS